MNRAEADPIVKMAAVIIELAIERAGVEHLITPEIKVAMIGRWVIEFLASVRVPASGIQNIKIEWPTGASP